MTPYRDQDEDGDDWEDDGEADFGDDQDSDEESTVPCPHCRHYILEDLPRCPYCDQHISEEDDAGPKKPLWVIATALVLLGIGVWWAFMDLHTRK